MGARTRRWLVLAAVNLGLGWGSPAAAQTQVPDAPPAERAAAPATEHAPAPATEPPGTVLLDDSAQKGTADNAPTRAEPADDDASALSEFNEELGPHGAWVDDPTYGTVWVPHSSSVGPGFAPYVTGGHWALDDAGQWIWVSHYPFGWVVFHYGRWVWTDGFGWAWIPGRRYAPSWVVWRVPAGPYAYVGWAPAPPLFVWRGGVAVPFGYSPVLAYVFVPSAYVFSPHVHHHVIVHRHLMRRVARSTRPYRVARPVPAGPSMATARVPQGSVPRERTAADPRAASRAARAIDPTTGRPAPLQRQPARGLSPSAPGGPSARGAAAPVPVTRGVWRRTRAVPQVTRAPVPASRASAPTPAASSTVVRRSAAPTSSRSVVRQPARRAASPPRAPARINVQRSRSVPPPSGGARVVPRSVRPRR